MWPLIGLATLCLAISTWQRDRMSDRRRQLESSKVQLAEKKERAAPVAKGREILLLANNHLVMNGQEKISSIEDLYRHLASDPDAAAELAVLQGPNPENSYWWPAVNALLAHQAPRRKQQRDEVAEGGHDESF